MYDGNILIAFGLILDACGALGVIVPDFPEKGRDRIRKWTLGTRKYQINLSRLSNKYREDNENDLSSEVESLWRAIQKGGLGLSDVDFHEVDGVEIEESDIIFHNHTKTTFPELYISRD